MKGFLIIASICSLRSFILGPGLLRAQGPQTQAVETVRQGPWDKQTVTGLIQSREEIKEGVDMRNKEGKKMRKRNGSICMSLCSLTHVYPALILRDYIAG